MIIPKRGVDVEEREEVVQGSAQNLEKGQDGTGEGRRNCLSVAASLMALKSVFQSLMMSSKPRRDVKHRKADLCP